MENDAKLIVLRLVHTVVWIFFNIVIFYMLWAAITNRMDALFWIGYGLILLEAAVLLYFKKICPLTIIARKYSASGKDNFDIYLPNWLARNTKMIYSGIMVVVVIITVYQLVK